MLNFFGEVIFRGAPKNRFLENFELQKFPTMEKPETVWLKGAYDLTKFESDRFRIQSLRVKKLVQPVKFTF